MGNRFRWLLFFCAIGFLLKSVFGETTQWSLAGFFFCGVLWYYLTWRRTRELDSPKPR